MLGHGESIFQNAQQARGVLLAYGFTPLVRLGDAEHWVRDNRRVILAYQGERAADVPLDRADYVWFRGDIDETVYASF